MSHFTPVKVNLKNKTALIAALNELGLEHEVYNTAQALKGHNASAGKKGHIIVRRDTLNKKYGGIHHMYNDLGIEYLSDEETVVHLDNTDNRSWGNDITNYLQEIVSKYAVHCLREAHPELNIESATVEKGKLRLQCSAADSSAVSF